MQQLPAGSKVLIYQGPDGLCYQTGAALLPNGKACACGTSSNWVPAAPNRYNKNRFGMVSPQAAAQISQQISNGSSGVGNTFAAIDLPNMGATGIARREGNSSPAAGDLVYTLTLNNTAGATVARQFLGDHPGTYVLLGNTELNPAGFVIAGSWGTNSKSQFVARTFDRPWRVKNIQFIASVATFFNLSNSYYFDTKPTPNAPTKDSLQLTTMLSADQYNPTIQWFNKSVRFDGVNGLDIEVPAGQSVTLQFSIISESSAGDQVMFD